MVNPNEDNFVQQRMASLEEAGNVSPNLVRGRALLNARLSVKPHGLAWKLAPVGICLVLVLAVPTAKAVAQTGVFSTDTLYGILMQLHMELYQVHRLVWEFFH